MHNKRKDMANIIEVANSAYEERDRAQEKLATLIQQAEREKMEFDREMTQVNNLIEKDKQMREFMRLKENEKAEIEKMNLDKSAAPDEERVKGSTKWIAQREKTANPISLDCVEIYEEAFAKIEAATNIHDID